MTRRHGWTRCLAGIGCGVAMGSLAAAPQPGTIAVTAGEAVEAEGAWTVNSRFATFQVGGPEAQNHRVEVRLALAKSRQPVWLTLQPENPAEAGSRGILNLSVSRDAEGRVLTVRPQQWDAEKQRWSWQRGDPSFSHVFWPPERNARAIKVLNDDGLTEPRSWIDRPLTLRFDLAEKRLTAWIDGYFVADLAPEAPVSGPLSLRLSTGDRLLSARISPLPSDAMRFETLDLAALANGRGLRLKSTPGLLTLDGTPFLPVDDAAGADHLDLRPAGWIDQARDPSSYYSAYDAGPPILFDERMPMLRVPKADYVAMHLLAVADDNSETVPRFTLRAGRYSAGMGQVFQRDFIAEVPRAGTPDAAIEAEGGRALYHVRLPLSLAFAQDVEADWIDMELTRDVRLAVRRPDPNRFQSRPIGLPSGVRIAAITLERSPLQMTVTSGETGHAFNEPQVPTFEVSLRNISAADQAFALEGTATTKSGEAVEARRKGTVPAGQSASVSLEFPIGRGYADLAITLRDAAGEPLLTRRTALALLPPLESRKFRHLSPFGTWDFAGGHFTSNDPDVVGPLYVKMGMRFGMFGFPIESLERYGIWYGNEANVHAGLEGMKRRIEGRADRMLPYAQVFHETSISGPHSSRVPDLFHDRPPYELNEAELKRFETMWEQATDYVDAAREAYPHLHMRFGNGPIAVREEFYRRGLPSDKFDSAGNESGVFGRMPEAQPPDIVAMNAAIWMDRQLLDRYGHTNKPVTLGYEVIYPSTNPGNLSYDTQADYMVRHALHALAWGMEHIRPGAISDMGNSYRFSNWGSSGFTRHRPDQSVKPSFVAFATMTWALDGATFVRVHDTGSLSAYALEFDGPEGGDKRYAMWTVRGRRPLTLKFDGRPEALTEIDDQARVRDLPANDSATVLLSPSPRYLVVRGGNFAGFALGASDHSGDLPAEGRMHPVVDLGQTDAWGTVPDANSMLEHYNNKTAPRRKGDFLFEPVAGFEGRNQVLRVTPRPIGHGKDTMPMYAERVHPEGFALPGEPTELGVWVNGNSGWGRVIFSLTDASGQVWTQIGAAETGDVSPWLRDWMPEELIDSMRMAGMEDWNTNDIFGDSRINFDGWRMLRVPLPGQYPGEEGRQYHWPRSSQWHCDGDGQVHYPLRLNRVIVELNARTLHADRFVPPSRPEIYLGPVVAIAGDPPAPRNANRD